MRRLTARERATSCSVLPFAGSTNFPQELYSWSAMASTLGVTRWHTLLRPRWSARERHHLQLYLDLRVPLRVPLQLPSCLRQNSTGRH